MHHSSSPEREVSWGNLRDDIWKFHASLTPWHKLPLLANKGWEWALSSDLYQHKIATKRLLVLLLTEKMHVFYCSGIKLSDTIIFVILFDPKWPKILGHFQATQEFLLQTLSRSDFWKLTPSLVNSCSQRNRYQIHSNLIRRKCWCEIVV